MDKFLQPITFSVLYDELATNDYELIKKGLYKRIVRLDRTVKRTGYIIGDCFKFDGEYGVGDKYKSKFLYDDDPEPPWFYPTKRIDFWEVALDMNEVVLVPKKEPEEFRFARLNQEQIDTGSENIWDDLW